MRYLVNMDNVSSVIRAAQAEPGVSVSIRSASTLRATERARRRTSSGAQIPQGRDWSQPRPEGAPAKHSKSSKTHDVTLQPKEDPEEDMTSLPPAARNLPFDKHELFLL